MRPTHHTCCDCGYAWPHGLDGSHNCVGRLTAQLAELSPSSNRYGVDADYFQKKLHLVLRDFASFKPEELARALFRLGKVADETVLAESEFAQAKPSANAVRQPRLIGWRTDNYLWETSDPDVAKNWEGNVGVLPIFEDDPNTTLKAPAAQARQVQVPEGSAEFSQFLSAVMDAAGLVRHGRRSKELSEYLGAQCMKYRHAAAQVAQAGQVPQAWLDVQTERRRQVEAEGWTPEHDDAHSHGEMARAAACYALAGSSAPNDGTAALLVSLAWPWDEQWWKPSTARRDLVKACALGLAEIERLDRAAAPGKEVGHE